MDLLSPETGPVGEGKSASDIVCLSRYAEFCNDFRAMNRGWTIPRDANKIASVMTSTSSSNCRMFSLSAVIAASNVSS